MIIKRERNPLPESLRNSAMAKFFYFEAPGEIRASQGGRVDYSPTDDEDENTNGENQQKPEVQVSTTTIRASRGGRTDYSPKDDNAEENTPAQQEQAPAEQTATTTTQTPAETSAPQEQAGANDIEADDVGEDDVDYSDSVPQDDEQNAPADDAGGGDQDETQDDGGDVDYSDDVTEDDVGGEEQTDGDTDEGQGDDQTEQTDDTENQGDEATENDAQTNIRKYNLYRDYIRLYNSIGSYIEKLETSRPDNIESNIVINSVLNKLHRTKDSLYEYMTIKYTDASYLASLMFFQQAISVVRLCFSLIRNNKPFISQEIRLEDLDKPVKKDDKSDKKNSKK